MELYINVYDFQALYIEIYKDIAFGRTSSADIMFMLHRQQYIIPASVYGF